MDGLGNLHGPLFAIAPSSSQQCLSRGSICLESKELAHGARLLCYAGESTTGLSATDAHGLPTADDDGTMIPPGNSWEELCSPMENSGHNLGNSLRELGHLMPSDLSDRHVQRRDVLSAQWSLNQANRPSFRDNVQHSVKGLLAWGRGKPNLNFAVIGCHADQMNFASRLHNRKTVSERVVSKQKPRPIFGQLGTGPRWSGFDQVPMLSPAASGNQRKLRPQRRAPALGLELSRERILSSLGHSDQGAALGATSSHRPRLSPAQYCAGGAASWWIIG
ncbi:hypothetical protein J2R78_001812 [Bradyrhizobium sp. USDA 4538]|nr:hypothetical protein [Bradyrhizobium sp. USDA 4538]MCP1899412.1 hypothetical protein [Bradyrhizobium sp. USDA 4537]MCP1986477.1 hypothetical protein [Bradyrhizobium sp. USDA 4539]